jgi:pimeloyl-ACP methyl ester carboxylesterase
LLAASRNGSPMRFDRFALAAVPLLLAGCATGQTGASAPRLAAQTYGPARGAAVETLVMVLHGDGSTSARPDHAGFAAAAARAIPRSASVALLRSGYADATGRASSAERGSGNGDNYTPERIAMVGDSVDALRRRYPNARTILVGDSGGAAIAANLAAIRPDLVDGMVLVSCPCSLSEWRRHMQARAPEEQWNEAVGSLDPLKTAGGILGSLRAALLVGSDDAVTLVRFSRAYAEALTLRGVATDYRIVPGKGHDLLDDPEVLAATQRLAASLPRKS